jgi:thiol-disulfide isomerase/thioredoxin
MQKRRFTHIFLWASSLILVTNLCVAQINFKIVFYDFDSHTVINRVIVQNFDKTVQKICIQSSASNVSLDTTEYPLDSALVIKAQGYQELSMALRQITTFDTIKLEKKSFLLNEVLIRPLSPNEVINQILSKRDYTTNRNEVFRVELFNKYKNRSSKSVGHFSGFVKLASKGKEFKEFELNKIKFVSSEPGTQILREGYLKVLLSSIFFNDHNMVFIDDFKKLTWSWSPYTQESDFDEIFTTISYKNRIDTIFLRYLFNDYRLVSIIKKTYHEDKSQKGLNQKAETVYLLNEENHFPLLFSTQSVGSLDDGKISWSDTTDVIISESGSLQKRNSTFDVENEFFRDYQKKLNDSRLERLLNELDSANDQIRNGRLSAKVKFVSTVYKMNEEYSVETFFNKIEEIDFNSMFWVKHQKRNFETIYNGSQVIIDKNNKLTVYDYQEYGNPESIRNLFEPIVRTRHFFSKYREVIIEKDVTITDTVIANQKLSVLYMPCQFDFMDYLDHVYIYFIPETKLIVGLKEIQELEDKHYWENIIFIENYEFNNDKFLDLFSTSSLSKGKIVKFKNPSIRIRRKNKYMKVINKILQNKPSGGDQNKFISAIENNQIDTSYLNIMLANTPYLDSKSSNNKNGLKIYFAWYNSCFYCKKLFPLLHKINSEYGSNVEIIGINTVDKIEEFIEEGWKDVLTFSKTYYDSEQIGDLLEINAYPTVIATDSDGKIIFRGEGYKEIESKLRLALKNHLSTKNR